MRKMQEEPGSWSTEGCRMVTKLYQHVLAMVFAVNEVNKNTKNLPNVTLGFHIYDSYYDAKMTTRATLDLLFKLHKFVPNYKCDTKKNLIAIIGGLGSDISFCMADILSLYKIPQFTCGSFPQEESNTAQVSSFYHTVPNEIHQDLGIIQLLKHFGWTWVGLLAEDNDSGECFLKTLEPLLSQNGICSAFTVRIPQQSSRNNIDELNSMARNIYQTFLGTKSRVFVVYGETMTILCLTGLMFLATPELKQNTSFGKVWIMTAQTDFPVMTFFRNLQMFHGTISFAIHSDDCPGFQIYLQNTKPYWTQGDGFFKDFWEQAFSCSFPNPSVPNEDKICIGEKNLGTLPASVFDMHMLGHSYNIYNVVYAVAHALQTIDTSKSSHRAMKSKNAELQDLRPWQLHPFLQGVSFNNSVGERVSFDENREMGTGFDIMNVLIYPNSSSLKVKVGRVDSKEGKHFIISEDIIVWQRGFNEVLPLSQCTDSCKPGYQKKMKEGEKFCCYDCAACPEGKISN
ncbi:vomeronasal type-2 receptor 26-like [Hemicordylus capensis]|uniref:vomeronasal type-2 receptor 26-like n=1 Tax=Hemicordylus capensis TaxID=884348 RepID=UPI0023034AAD|nr:vomeronasal type-2 receptor 26-like [Hemicordylus capensis]